MIARVAIVVLILALAVVFVVVRFGEKKAAEGAEIDDLEWMVGYWRGEKDDVVMEELWLAPAGGRMIGLHRDVPEEGDVLSEHLRIEGGAGGVDYVAAPIGRQEARFRLIELGDKRALFENRKHDYPERILYWADHRGLHVRIEGETDGKQRHEEWLWRRSRIGDAW
jgi:hypothetical protein